MWQSHSRCFHTGHGPNRFRSITARCYTRAQLSQTAVTGITRLLIGYRKRGYFRSFRVKLFGNAEIGTVCLHCSTVVMMLGTMLTLMRKYLFSSKNGGLFISFNCF